MISSARGSKLSNIVAVFLPLGSTLYGLSPLATRSMKSFLAAWISARIRLSQVSRSSPARVLRTRMVRLWLGWGLLI